MFLNLLPFCPFSDDEHRTFYFYNFYSKKRQINPLPFEHLLCEIIVSDIWKSESEVKESKVLLYFPISKKSGECHTYRTGEIKIAIVSKKKKKERKKTNLETINREGCLNSNVLPYFSLLIISSVCVSLCMSCYCYSTNQNAVYYKSNSP